MSGTETFWWGALGGLIGYFLAFVFPEFRNIAVSGKIQFSFIRVLAYIPFLASYVVMGGVAAYYVGDAELPKHAITYGLTWEVVFKVGGEATRAAVSKLRKS